MKGIDISSYQDNIDFHKVKNTGIQIVYIKATEGLTYSNPLLKSQYSGAKAAGLNIGFYHYLRANDPILEAKHFLGITQKLTSDCRYVIDVEEAFGQTKQKISDSVHKFSAYLISNKKQVCIYTSDNFYANSLDNCVKEIPLWVAHYAVAKPYATKYIGFQYSSSGTVTGINGLVDLNEFESDIFISSSKTFVKTFQHAASLAGFRDKSANMLTEDGIKGVRTDEVIAKVLLSLGESNELIRWIQQRLISLGVSVGAAGADGDFGGKTLVVVKHFQASRGLKADGIVGPCTIIELLK